MGSAYDAPNTPIASAKRSRPKPGLASPAPQAKTPSFTKADTTPPSSNVTGTPPPGPPVSINSPMHGATLVRRLHPDAKDGDADQEKENSGGAEDASWAQRKMDALFSPVLNFLGGDENDEADAKGDAGAGADEKETKAGKAPAAPQVEDDYYAAQLRQQELQQQQQEEGGDDGYEDEFNPYLFIKQLPPYAEVAIPNKLCLPPKTDPPLPHEKLCLVLDLDETLVHCTVEPIPDPDMVFPVEFGGVEYKVHVRKRPHLEYFLEMVHDKFEVIVFTASQRVYADSLLNRIDPEGKYIKHRMFRESCLPVEGNYLKDLTVLGRDLKTAVLVDNSPHAFGYQVDNGIPIESWFDDPNDTELVKLEMFLRTLQGASDVRPLVRNKFKTWKLCQNA